jgi:hypothetical protein
VSRENRSSPYPIWQQHALIILECARDIVERFIAEAPPPDNGARVVYLAHTKDR